MVSLDVLFTPKGTICQPLPAPTPTSYALLGLLAIKPWTTYELAAQMDRTMNRFWPRARSKLYEEPKKLVALGLAQASKEAVGRRPRTRLQHHARKAGGRWPRGCRRRARVRCSSTSSC